MIKSILAAGCSLAALMLVPFAGAALTPTTASAQEWTYQAPKITCQEDMPCWRAWMGNGEVGPGAPAYLFLPEGPSFDAIAPLFGYVADA